MGTIVMGIISFILIIIMVILVGIMLYAIASSLKEIKKCIKSEEWSLAFLCGLLFLIQCGATIIVIKVFIHCILN